MVQACGALAEAEQREECYRVAAQTLGADADADDAPPTLEERVVVAPDERAADPAQSPPAESAPPADTAPPPEAASVIEAAPVQQPAAVVKAAPFVKAEPPVVADPPVGPEPPVEAQPRAEARPAVAEPQQAPPSPGIVVTTVQRASVTIPQRFTAQVTDHRKLVRDRQLLVLDGKLLFEGDNAASSRIKVGQSVEVESVSRFRARRFEIMGPSKRKFSALRIRCERDDLGSDNRRKCRIMLRDAE